MKVCADLVGELLDLVKEHRFGQQLRDHHIMPGRKMGPGGREGDRPGQQPRSLGVLAPAAEHAPDPVDVEVQRERVVRDVHPGQRGLAADWRPVEQDHPGHRAILDAVRV